VTKSVIDRNFGRLRSLAANLSDPEDRRALYNFCRAMRRHEPERYDEQWVPYLSSLRLPAPFITLEPGELEGGWEVLPTARFNASLHLYAPEDWPRDEATLGRLHDIEWSRPPGTPDELASVLDHPIASRVLSLEVLPLSSRYVPTEFGIEELVATLTTTDALPRLERLHLGLDSAPLPSHLTRLFDAFDLTRLSLRPTLSSTGRHSIAPLCEALFDIPGFERVDEFALGRGTSTSAHFMLDRAEGRFELGHGFRDAEAFFARLVDAPWSVPMRALHVGAGQMSAGVLERVAAADRCARLESLTLSQGELDAGDVEAFMRSWGGTPTLETLTLSSFRFDVLSEVSRVTRLEGLRHLHVRYSDVSEGALDALDRAAHLAGLETLTLCSNQGVDQEHTRERLRTNPHLSSCVILTEAW
jgi:hypothetical protein